MILAILAILGGLVAAFYGLRWLIELTWAPLPELQPHDPIRRAARRDRIEDFRQRRTIEHEEES